MANEVAKLSFWGVRGSTPTVDRATWRYGGNTPCLELTTPDGGRLILDCGTGLRMLGNRLAAATGQDCGRAYPRNSLPLGPHPGHSVFCAALSRTK